MLVGCGGEPSWKRSVTANGLPNVLTQAKAEAIFVSLLDAGLEPVFFPQGVETPWRVLVSSGKRLTIGLGQWTNDGPGWNAHILTVESKGGSWAFRFGGDCASFGPTPRAGQSVVEALEYSLGLEANQIDVQVTERQCAGARDPEPYLHTPWVVETADTVTLYLTSDPVVGGATCPSNPIVTRTITLNSPLGDRQVIDGWLYPATPLG
jgi:hypothetical protein